MCRGLLGGLRSQSRVSRHRQMHHIPHRLSVAVWQLRKLAALGPSGRMSSATRSQKGSVSIPKDIRAGGGNLPIFMLSSVGDSLHRNVSYADLGLSGLLQKPVDPKALVQTLRAKLPTDAAK